MDITQGVYASRPRIDPDITDEVSSVENELLNMPTEAWA